MLGGIGIGFSPTYEDPIAGAWARASGAAPSVRAAVSAFVTGSKADGDWGIFSRFHLMCAGLADADYSVSLVDLVDPSKVGSRVNACTYVGGQGFIGDGVSMHVDWGEYYDAGGLFARDDHHIGFGISGGATTATRALGTASGSSIFATARGSNGTETWSGCDGTNDIFYTRSGSPSTPNGRRIVTRPGPTLKKGYFNGAPGTPLTTASTVAVPASNACALRSSSVYSPHRMSYMHWGSAVTSDAQAARIDARIAALLAAIGAAT